MLLSTQLNLCECVWEKEKGKIWTVQYLSFRMESCLKG